MQNRMRRLLSAALAVALIPLSLTIAAAEAPSSCPGTHVAGTVVAVDEATGLVTLNTGGGALCTVTVSQTETQHPIGELLGRYFAGANADALSAALAATEVWVVCPTEDGCVLAAADDPGAVRGWVVGVTPNVDGSHTLEIMLEGAPDHVFVTSPDADQAEQIARALARLQVSWDLEPGDAGPVVPDAALDIAQLHQDGLGFGVIVKLYAIAEASQANCPAAPAPADPPCGVTVDELVAEFRAGQGLGQLFQRYGKPSLLGVGHVRQALRAENEALAATGTPAATGTAAPGDTPVPPATNDFPACAQAGAAAHNPHCTTAVPGSNGNHGNGNNGHGNNGNNGTGGGHGKP